MTRREVIHDSDGLVIAAVCTSKPLSEQARTALAELAEVARAFQQQRDPEGVLGDRQRRRIDRLMKRQTPECPYCDRIENHDGRCMSAAQVIVAEETARRAEERVDEP